MLFYPANANVNLAARFISARGIPVLSCSSELWRIPFINAVEWGGLEERGGSLLWLVQNSSLYLRLSLC